MFTSLAHTHTRCKRAMEEDVEEEESLCQNSVESQHQELLHGLGDLIQEYLSDSPFIHVPPSPTSQPAYNDATEVVSSVDGKYFILNFILASIIVFFVFFYF